MCDTLTYDFVNILRQARPDVPIVMLEGPIYPYARYDSFFRNYLPRKNAAFRRNYDRLKAENPENLYYVTSTISTASRTTAQSTAYTSPTSASAITPTSSHHPPQHPQHQKVVPQYNAVYFKGTTKGRAKKPHSGDNLGTA